MPHSARRFDSQQPCEIKVAASQSGVRNAASTKTHNYYGSRYNGENSREEAEEVLNSRIIIALVLILF